MIDLKADIRLKGDILFYNFVGWQKNAAVQIAHTGILNQTSLGFKVNAAILL